MMCARSLTWLSTVVSLSFNSLSIDVGRYVRNSLDSGLIEPSFLDKIGTGANGREKFFFYITETDGLLDAVRKSGNAEYLAEARKIYGLRKFTEKRPASSTNSFVNLVCLI